MIAKIKPMHRLAQAVMYNSGYFYYKKVYRQNNYAQFFASIHNTRSGKRCFIIGNGPSLITADLNKLLDEDCFAANYIFLVYPGTAWRPKYYVMGDRYTKITEEQIENVGAEIAFLGDYFCRFNDILPKNAVCLHQHVRLFESHCKASSDISKYVANLATVSFISMQIAAYMGYSEIYLLGFDHSYSMELSRNGTVIKTDAKQSHFFKTADTSVDPKDMVGNTYGMTRAYEAFRDYAREHDIVVKNATRGGKLEVFERVDFDSLF